MNLFYLDEDVTKCAQAHVQRHVFKMMVEVAQMMSTAVRLSNGVETVLTHPGNGRQKTVWALPGEQYVAIEEGGWDILDRAAYQVSHQNHPCTIWIRESLDNYLYAKELVYALNEEAMWRSERDPNDLYSAYVTVRDLPVPNIPSIGRTPMRCAMPEFYMLGDAVLNYRLYYRGSKHHLANWGRRETAPSWWDELASPEFLFDLAWKHLWPDPRFIMGHKYAMKIALGRLWPNSDLHDDITFDETTRTLSYREDDCGYYANWIIGTSLMTCQGDPARDQPAEILVDVYKGIIVK